MAKSLEQILGYVFLTGLVEQVKTGIPKVLPDAFWSTKGEVMGDAGRYTRYAGTRRVSRRVEYGAPSIQRTLSEIGSFDVKLDHTYEHIRLKVLDYQNLRNYTDYGMQNMGIQEVTRQAAQFRALFDNTRLATIYSLLALGHIYWDVDGELLPSSSGNVLDQNFGINANNLNQLNSAIAASWATTSTDIPAHLRTLKRQSLQLTGYEIKHCFYGINIPSYFANNTALQVYLSRNPQRNQEFLDSGEIPNGLFGIEWHPVYKAFYSDSADTIQNFFGADAAVFLPEIDSTVYELLEGSYQVPKNYNVYSTLQSVMGAYETVHGMFSYGVPEFDPMTAKIFHGDTFLPVFKVPDAVFIGDVTP